MKITFETLREVPSLSDSLSTYTKQNNKKAYIVICVLYCIVYRRYVLWNSSRKRQHFKQLFSHSLEKSNPILQTTRNRDGIMKEGKVSCICTYLVKNITTIARGKHYYAEYRNSKQYKQNFVRKTEIDEHIFLKAEAPKQYLTDGQPVRVNNIIERKKMRKQLNRKPDNEEENQVKTTSN